MAHSARQHASPIAGVEAVSLCSSHSFPRHAHDQFGIGIVTEGAQRSWSLIGDVEAGPGDIIMVNPGEMHDGAPLSGARSWHMLYLAPDLFSRELAGEALPRGDVLLRPVVRDGGLALDVSRLLRRMAAEPSDALGLEQDLLVCLVQAAGRHHLHGRTVEFQGLPGIGRAVQRLEDAPEAPVSLSELAGLADISRFQLVRAFRRHLGITPHAYQVQLRVRLAKRLMASGHSPADAAAAAGFADQAHLTRAFSRQFGVTPGRYRAAQFPSRR